jgi:hypothetical protein
MLELTLAAALWAGSPGRNLLVVGSGVERHLRMWIHDHLGDVAGTGAVLRRPEAEREAGGEVSGTPANHRQLRCHYGGQPCEQV